MAVRADDRVTRHGESLFGDQAVLDAHLPHLEIVRDALRGGELPDQGALLRRLDILVGRKVVWHQRDFILIEYLCPARALELAQMLDTFNRERRSIEDDIKAEALAMLEGLDLGAAQGAGDGTAAISLFAPHWHEGVIGIVAGRIKDREHRPTFVFAPAEDGTLRGSGRSIVGFHLRDALDLIAKREPGLVLRFGGHAMAAGCSLVPDGYARFHAALNRVAGEWLEPSQLQRRVEVDGPLPVQWLLPEMASLLGAQVWGQGFAAPLFSARVQVRQQRLIGERHLKAKVRLVDAEGAPGNALFDLVAWGRTDFLPDEARIAYRLESNTWQGITQVQLVLEAIEG